MRTTNPILDPHWAVSSIGLEDLVLEYMTSSADDAHEPALSAVTP